MGQLSEQDAHELAAGFASDFHGTPSQPPRFIAAVATMDIVDLAAALTEKHGLRAYDAVQLATAITIRRLQPACDTFVCFDHGLAAAADIERFTITAHPAT